MNLLNARAFFFVIRINPHKSTSSLVHTPMIFLVLLQFSLLINTARGIRGLIDPDKRQLSPHAIKLTNETYWEELRSVPPERKCVIEFYAHWCPACRKFAKQFDEVAKFFNVAPRPKPSVDVFSIDCAEENWLCKRFEVNAYPMVYFGSAEGFLSERKEDLKEVKWREGESRMRTGAKQIIDFVGPLVIPSTKYAFDNEAEGGLRQATDTASKGDEGENVSSSSSSSSSKQENENLARLAFENDRKKDQEYTTVRTMTSKDDLERATVEMWKQIVYDAEIASGKYRELSKQKSTKNNDKSISTSLDSLSSLSSKSDNIEINKEDEARAELEKVKIAIGSIIYAFSKTHPIAECRASFKGLLPGSKEGEEEEVLANDDDDDDDKGKMMTNEELEASDDPLLEIASRRIMNRKKTITIQHHLFWDDKTNALSEFASKTFTPCGRKKSPEWSDCKPSVANSGARGYTCGIWLLLHSTALRSKELDKNLGGRIWYDAFVNGFIRNFFNCIECREHFLKMADATKGYEIETPEEISFWIWRRHNEVNERLLSDGDVAGDPKFPKQQWPDIQSCSKCRHTDGSWNDDNVLRFLRVFFLANEGPKPRSNRAKLINVNKKSPRQFEGNLFGNGNFRNALSSVFIKSSVIFIIVVVVGYGYFSRDKVFKRFHRKVKKKAFDDWP